MLKRNRDIRGVFDGDNVGHRTDSRLNKEDVSQYLQVYTVHFVQFIIQTTQCTIYILKTIFYIVSTATCFDAVASSFSLCLQPYCFYNFIKQKIRFPEDDTNASKHVRVHGTYDIKIHYIYIYVCVCVCVFVCLFCASVV